MWTLSSVEHALDAVPTKPRIWNTPEVPRDFWVKSITSVTEGIRGLKWLWVPEKITTKFEWITTDLIRKSGKLLEGLKIDKKKIDAIIAPVLGTILWFIWEKSIPDEVKERYLQLVREAIDDLSEVSLEQIESVKKRQTEIAGPFSSDDPSYYLGEIIKTRISWQLGFSESVIRSFREERAKAPDGSEYQKENLWKYVLHIQWMDKKFGTHLYETIAIPLLAGKIDQLPKDIQMEIRIARDLSSANLDYIVWRGFLDEINKRTPLRGRQTLLNFLKWGNLSELSLPASSPDRYIMIDGEKVDLIKTLLGNNQRGRYFQAYENEARSLRSTAKWGKDTFFSSTPTFEWGKLMTWDILDSMKGLNMQQVIILISQLIPIIPTIGSVVGAIDSSRNLANGISLTGESINIPLEWLSAIADTLDTITLWVWQFGKLIKAKKTVELIAKMKSVFSNLPVIIEKALAQEKMTEGKKKFIESLWTMLEKIWPALEALWVQIQVIKKIIDKYTIKTEEKKILSWENQWRRTLEEWRKADIPKAAELNKRIAKITQSEWISGEAARWLVLAEDVYKKFWISLDGSNIKELLSIHNIGKQGESIGNYWVNSLWEKLGQSKLLFQKMWMSEEKATELSKFLIKNGYLWDIALKPWDMALVERSRASGGPEKKILAQIMKFLEWGRVLLRYPDGLVVEKKMEQMIKLSFQKWEKVVIERSRASGWWSIIWEFLWYTDDGLAFLKYPDGTEVYKPVNLVKGIPIEQGPRGITKDEKYGQFLYPKGQEFHSGPVIIVSDWVPGVIYWTTDTGLYKVGIIDRNTREVISTQFLTKEEIISKNWSLSERLAQWVNAVKKWIDVGAEWIGKWLKKIWFQKEREVAIEKNNEELRRLQELKEWKYLSELWPNWLRAKMEQWAVGNCYFVAALDALKAHPNCMQYLKSMIQPATDGNGWIVKFRWHDTSTRVTMQDVAEMGDARINGQLGDAILERAYWRLRQHQYDPSLRWGFQAKEIERSERTMMARTDSGKKTHEWWWMSTVFKDFFWDAAHNEDIENFKYSKDMGSLKEKLSKLKWDEVITASIYSIKDTINLINQEYLRIASLPWADRWTVLEELLGRLRPYFPQVNQTNIDSLIKMAQWSQFEWDIHTFTIPDFNWKPQSFHFQHAYSIGDYDLQAGWMEVINPHDTQGKKYKLKLDDVLNIFGRLTITKLQPN